MSRTEVETARGTWTPPGALARRAILRGARTIAVVGASSKPNRASHFVLTYLRSNSTDYEVWPVTPSEDEILGLQAYPSLADLPGTPDIVDVFRKPDDLPEVAQEAVDAGAYQSGGGEFWVARAGGAVVGTIAAIRIAPDAVALRKMFVAREQRGAVGLAARLMDTLVDWAAAAGVRTVYLGTTAVMNAAHRFYEKQGFTEIDAGELPPSFPRMAVDSRFYRRELA